MSEEYVINKETFGGHLANSYPLEQVLAFMSGKTVELTSFGGSPCEYCDKPIINDYKTENEYVFYHYEVGFTDSIESDISREYDEVEFSVLYCEHCNKWFTYIE